MPSLPSRRVPVVLSSSSALLWPGAQQHDLAVGQAGLGLPGGILKSARAPQVLRLAVARRSTVWWKRV